MINVIKDQGRQGDVFVDPVDNIDFNDLEEITSQEKNRIVLAYGETTGHAHAIYDEGVKYMKSKSTGNIYLIVDNTKAALKHEEHAPIPLKKKLYTVETQRQYINNKEVTVAD